MDLQKYFILLYPYQRHSFKVTLVTKVRIFSRHYQGWHNLESLYGWVFRYLPSIVVDLNPNDFEEKLLNAEGPWVVDFFAPWCGHCVQFAPYYEKLAKVKYDLFFKSISGFLTIFITLCMRRVSICRLRDSVVFVILSCS